MKKSESNGHEIESDGRMVWVNGPDGTCVARLGPKGGEVLDQFGWQTIESEPFEAWRGRVATDLEVDVGTEHRPHWAVS